MAAGYRRRGTRSIAGPLQVRIGEEKEEEQSNCIAAKVGRMSWRRVKRVESLGMRRTGVRDEVGWGGVEALVEALADAMAYCVRPPPLQLQIFLLLILMMFAFCD